MTLLTTDKLSYLVGDNINKQIDNKTSLVTFKCRQWNESSASIMI